MILDRCQVAEVKLSTKLMILLNLSSDDPVLYYRQIRPEKRDASNADHLRLFSDGPQRSVVYYMTFYAIFWLMWFRPWRYPMARSTMSLVDPTNVFARYGLPILFISILGLLFFLAAAKTVNYRANLPN
jgi:hypothetical protein